MKIAIFHNFLDNIGGAEYVDLIMARELNADIYTTNIDRENIKKMGFADILPKIHSIGRIPINAPWRQEMAYWKFRRLNLGRKYDFYIIAGDWAMSGSVHNKPHFWYAYSPTREIWDLYKYTRNNTVPFLFRPIFDIWVIIRRIINKWDAKKIERIIAISANVQGRIRKYLGRESDVIYPPIETSKYHFKQNGNFWLAVNRLISHKRVDMQIKAFVNLPKEKLIIVGSHEQSRHFLAYADYCKRIKPSNVEIRSWVSEAELLELYSNCKGFISTSLDEDFGMTPLEAMASSKPVIAPNEGGYKETIKSGQNGILIDKINPEKLSDAINKLSRKLAENPQKYKEACAAQAKKFDVSEFISRIKYILAEIK